MINTKEWKIKVQDKIECNYGKVNKRKGYGKDKYTFINWIHIDFDDNYVLNGELKNSRGLNIMPYQIDQYDTDIIDYYNEKGFENYHKIPDGKIQFVLTYKNTMGPIKNCKHSEWYYNTDLNTESKPEEISNELNKLLSELINR